MRELESLEGVIAGMESRISEIEAMFADPGFFPETRQGIRIASGGTGSGEGGSGKPLSPLGGARNQTCLF